MILNGVGRNKKLGMLKRTFESMDPKLWKKLYVSLVRPYAVQAWNPHLQEIDKIESVQKKANRIPLGFHVRKNLIDYD